MGQQEIFGFLKKHRNQWFTVNKLMKNKVSKAERSSVTMGVYRLRKRCDIEFRKVIYNGKPSNKEYEYRYNPNCKQYDSYDDKFAEVFNHGR